MLAPELLLHNNASSQDTLCQNFSPLVLSALDTFARLTNQTAFIIDFDNHRLIYKTDRLLFLDETPQNDIILSLPVPYWSNITGETLHKLASIRNNYMVNGIDLEKDEFEKHICIIDYPIIVSKHQIFITQKFTPLTIRHDGITKVGLFTISHSATKRMECQIISTSGRRYAFDFKKQEFTANNSPYELSDRELTILNRSKMGMSNKEISSSLNISENTVKTHKARIYKKMKVNNLSEALASLGNYLQK